MSLLNIFKKKPATKAKESERTEELKGKRTEEQVAQAGTVPSSKMGGLSPLRNKRTEEQKNRRTEKKKAEKVTGRHGRLAHVLLQPRITEKATMLSGLNVYTFNIPKNITKIQVKEAVQDIYNVKPVKVRMIMIPSKKISVRGVRGKSGVKPGGKKAYIYLREGETIELT